MILYQYMHPFRLCQARNSKTRPRRSLHGCRLFQPIVLFYAVGAVDSTAYQYRGDRLKQQLLGAIFASAAVFAFIVGFDYSVDIGAVLPESLAKGLKEASMYFAVFGMHNK